MNGTDGGPVGTTSGSTWSPLRVRVFRDLWLAQFASNIGSWVQTVGAQWLLVGHGAGQVALVQVAAGLPVLFLALPAGVLADLVDRRRLLLAMQAAMALVAAALAVLAFVGLLGPWTLLSLTFSWAVATRSTGLPGRQCSRRWSRVTRCARPPPWEP